MTAQPRVRELLLDDTPGVAPLALALELGWATLPVPARTIVGLTAEGARAHPGALVLAPLTEYAALQESYTILPELAVGGQHSLPAILVADRRLDEVDDPIVDLAEVSRATECLARATMLKFYGITAAAWRRDEPGPTVAGAAPPLTVEIRDGGEALHLLEAPGERVISDLGKAWFILSGLPPVSHLLLAPDAALGEEAALRATLDALTAALAVVHERRRELRRTLAERYGVAREFLNDFYSDQFLTLTGDAQKSVIALFPEGAWGMDLPTVSRLKLAPWARRA